MTSKISTLILAIACLAVGLFSSCQSSKIAYGNSYYFKATPKAVPQKEVSPETQQVIASVEKVPMKEVSATERKEALEQKITNLQHHQKQIEETQAALDQASTAQEKREVRRQQRAEKKAFRQELKQLTREIRTAPQEVQKENLSSNGRLGLIFAAIGLILLLVVPGSVGTILGTILLVVGILLLILDLV
ncbi:hypothetical protein [Tunicatimonas pelagia]|uniref:hypothetical protein n=1 Tax=Tunicatimonas pelagia TaxID=931531 RepID=UPI00266606BE|nr:hypothetical protein [Tunicatimonas pelagia]WKN43836.1 hypothetical protein P0M28_02480 [Tunicatimonas pelagia]